ncbi:MAG TPA: 1-acyl-sn-glycerol-3-phosphate acyltransferase, partial [Anaeromyxobacteraceae bacterium]|nr:1-acyl-sn-glycerol-3-phosphate acyltransferase [Anaeromyxobacteraceae bacterium]
RDGAGLPTSVAQRADRQQFLMKTHAVLKTLVRLKYFSWEIEGARHLPRQGPVVYAMNHAGWFALDTIMVGCSVAESIGVSRAPYFAAVDASLAAPVFGSYLKRIGGLPASLFRHPQRLPAEFESYGICPEGVLGNCKPFWEAYRMREWNRGFVRLAMALKAVIVPVAVFGGEECLPVAWTVKVLEPLIGSIVGLPLAPVPLPARWKIIFHEPEQLTTPSGPSRRSSDQCNTIAQRLRGVVQKTLEREAARRPLAQLSSFVAAIHRARERTDAPDPLDPLL